MNFNEQLDAINNFTSIDECINNYDFMLDAEHIHIENCLGNGYKHKRHSCFTDDEILVLADALHRKFDDILG